MAIVPHVPKIIVLIVFNCLCFCQVSTSYLVNTIRNDFLAVAVTYIIAMLYAISITISAKRSAEVIENDDRNDQNSAKEQFKSAYVQITGVCFFLIPAVLDDIFQLFKDGECIGPYVGIRCNVSNCAACITMTSVRIVFVGTQVVYMMWAAQVIRRRDRLRVDTWPHLVNAGVDISMIIYDILHESRHLLSPGTEHMHPVEVCFNHADKLSPYYDMSQDCLKGETDIAILREKIEPYISPLVIEFYFMAAALNIGQWQIVAEMQQNAARQVNPIPEDEIHREHPNENVVPQGNPALDENAALGDEEIPTPHDNHDEIPDSRQVEIPAAPAEIPPLDENNHSIQDPPQPQPPRERIVGQHAGINVAFYIPFLSISVNIVVCIASQGNSETFLLPFNALYTANVLGAAFIVLYMVRTLCGDYKRTHEQPIQLHINNEMGVVIVSACGIHVYKFALFLPDILTLVDKQAADLIFYDSPFNDPAYRYAWFILEFTNIIAEILLTGASIILVLLLHSDVRTQSFTPLHSKTMKGFLYALAFGSFVFWIFRSMVTINLAQSFITQVRFYGPDSWRKIVRIVNPPSVYYHFHITLIIVEYIVAMA